MRRNMRLSRGAAVYMLLIGILCNFEMKADEVPGQSTHQMMKDCMAKQRASDSGRSTEDLKKLCKDLTKTEKQNADRELAAERQTPRN